MRIGQHGRRGPWLCYCRGVELTRDSQIELLVARQGDAFRLYVAGWIPDYLREHLDEHGEAARVTFDSQALERSMWDSDAPYRIRQVPAGFEVEATGRSADYLARYVADVLGDARL